MSQLSRIPGPEITAHSLLTAPWQGWFEQLYEYLTTAQGFPSVGFTWSAKQQFQAGLGVFGAAGPAQLAGWGTPTGPAVVANFPGASATLLQTSTALAQVIATLKAIGFYAA